MRRFLAQSLCIATLATVAHAQASAVVPIGTGARAGNASTSIGLGDTTARAQYLYDKSATGLTTATTIRRVSLRLDESAISPARNDLDVSVRLSTRAIDASRLPFANFDFNDGLTLGTWSSMRLSLPAVTTTGVAQRFFDLPLSAPFVTDNDGTLCVDIKYSTSATGPFTQRFDSERDFQDRFRRENYGVACPSTVRTGAAGFFVGNTNSLGAYTFIQGIPEGSIALAWVGTSRIDKTLSFTYASQVCKGYTIADAIHPIPVIVPRSSSYARFSWLDPQRLANPLLAGIRFNVQHMFFDPKLQLAMSDGLEIVIGNDTTGNSFVTVYGSSREKAGFDPDVDSATSFWSGAPILRLK